MQILAQSLVPANPTPYLHLGYTSATNVAQTRDAGYPAVLALALGMTLGGLLLATALAKTVRRRWAGGVLLAAGVLLLAAAYLPVWPLRYTQPDRATRDFAQKIHQRLAIDAAMGQPLPLDLRACAQADPWFEAYLRDGWHRDFRLARQLRDGKARYTVTSAGPDGRFNTRDDITVREPTPSLPQRK